MFSLYRVTKPFNIVTALWALCFYLYYSLQMQKAYLEGASLSFFGTLFVYEYLQSKKIHILSLLVLLALFWRLDQGLLMSGLTGSTMVLFYERFFRRIPFVKSASIAFTWCCLLNLEYFTSKLTIFLESFILVFLLALCFDIRDFRVDNFATVPGKIGIKQTELTVMALWLLYLVIHFKFSEFSTYEILVNGFLTAYLFFFLPKIKKSQNPLLTIAVLDGIFLWQLLFFLIHQAKS